MSSACTVPPAHKRTDQTKQTKLTNLTKLPILGATALMDLSLHVQVHVSTVCKMVQNIQID